MSTVDLVFTHLVTVLCPRTTGCFSLFYTAAASTEILRIAIALASPAVLAVDRCPFDLVAGVFSLPLRWREFTSVSRYLGSLSNAYLSCKLLHFTKVCPIRPGLRFASDLGAAPRSCDMLVWAGSVLHTAPTSLLVAYNRYMLPGKANFIVPTACVCIASSTTPAFFEKRSASEVGLPCPALGLLCTQVVSSAALA